MQEEYGKDQVLKIINSVIAKVAESEDTQSTTIYTQLSEVKNIIDKAKEEIGSARPADITDTHIPSATDELDAVIEATAEATGSIMDACEVIEEKAESIGSDGGNQICMEVTKIYEACSFQDITGQRISKVVGALKDIEMKVNALLDVIGNKMPGFDDDTSKVSSSDRSDAALLNGPQLPGSAITQDDIDKLLSDF